MLRIGRPLAFLVFACTIVLFVIAASYAATMAGGVYASRWNIVGVVALIGAWLCYRKVGSPKALTWPAAWRDNLDGALCVLPFLPLAPCMWALYLRNGPCAVATAGISLAIWGIRLLVLPGAYAPRHRKAPTKANIGYGWEVDLRSAAEIAAEKPRVGQRWKRQ